MIILCSVQNFGYYGIMIWLPNYLSTRFGYVLTKSAIWTSVTIGGMALGIFLFGHIVDLIGRLLVGGAVMGFFVNGMLGGYGPLMSELYPTAARHRAERLLQHRARRCRLGPAGRGRRQRRLWLSDGYRTAGVALRSGHCGVAAADSGTEGCRAGLRGRLPRMPGCYNHATDLPDVSRCFAGASGAERPPGYFAWGCFRNFGVGQ
jgi:MFS family permease